MIDFDTTNFKAILLVRSSHIDLSLSDYLGTLVGSRTVRNYRWCSIYLVYVYTPNTRNLHRHRVITRPACLIL